MLVMYVTFFFVPLLLVSGQNPSDCKTKATCRDCMQEIDCIWCISLVNDTGASHCANVSAIPHNWCNQNNIISLPTVKKTVLNAPFTSNTKKQVQLMPQHVKISLRKGEKVDVHFQYKQAENYPVDLYYIMDLSASMDPYREKLGKLGVELAKALKNLTKNVALGFGSFIDKVDLPFVSTVPAKLTSPCQLNGKPCISPYSFKNHLNMTYNYTEFTKKVTDARVSGNLDSPEGGLDAIMQAIVCKQLGWRPNARHLLVFSTDAEFHIAGDGKLAGVIEPNDAKCHMVNNKYTDYLIYDYPSVSQINSVAKDNNVNIIFAIAKRPNIRYSYQKLSHQIKNSEYGELEDRGTNNVVNLVVTNYKKIVQSVKLTSNVSKENVDIQFKPATFTNVHVGEIIDFTATIKPIKCVENQIISIKPEALDESVIIELNVLCECPCSATNHSTYQQNSNKCTGTGDLECGICKCPPGRFGAMCQCDRSTSMSEDTKNCIKDGTGPICSGVGECICGICVCNKPLKKDVIIDGPFCECDNYSCRKDDDDLICSGRGKCVCGKCECDPGYSMDACQCRNDNTTCIAPGSNKICSDHGTCVCGECVCTPGEGHSGEHCAECTTCPARRCDEFRHCVECQAYQTGIYDSDECKNKCTQFQTKIVEKLNGENDNNIKKCRVPDNAGCLIIFDYYDKNKMLTVRAEKEKLCAGPPNVLAWILGVIGTILIAGLIMLIIWKIFTTVHDRREYAKFENERKALRWHRNENPLYKEATSTFANPAYNRSSRLASK